MQRKPLSRPPKDNQQVSEYTNAIKRGSRNYYVSSSKRGWNVRRADAAEIDSYFSSKAEAITHARKSASNADIVVHNQDGTITLIEIKKTRSQ